LARHAYVWGLWLVPSNVSDQFRLGSTHHWHDLYGPLDPNQAHQLLKKAQVAMPHQNFKVLAHLTGVRPSTQSRKVWMGAHPAHPQAFILNGMGSKGCLMAPSYAKTFTQHLQAGTMPIVQQA
jgi:glycine/D-amino acid oxidase-like deaminating enzyme